jgi:FdhD protein
MSSLHTDSLITAYSAAAEPLVGPDQVAVEEPLELRVEGRSVAITMRTPGHDEELAVGFLLTEGVIASADDLLEINRCPTTTGASGNIIDVLLRRPGSVDFERLTRHVFTSSSCGLCGKATIEAVRGRSARLSETITVAPETLRALPNQLAALQPGFRQTGGLHAAGLFSPGGTLQIVREDVGRHNAVDKVIGAAALRRSGSMPPGRQPFPHPLGLFVSGRVSFEIVQKALAAGIPLIAAVSAPTSLAIELARESGQTLVGFIRDGRFNVYAGQLKP